MIKPSNYRRFTFIYVTKAVEMLQLTIFISLLLLVNSRPMFKNISTKLKADIIKNTGSSYTLYKFQTLNSQRTGMKTVYMILRKNRIDKENDNAPSSRIHGFWGK